MKKILMIAYDFPPINDSGTARPLYFAKYLHEFGYHPIVITRKGSGGKSLDESLLDEISEKCEVIRAEPWDFDDWREWFARASSFLGLIPFILGKKNHRRISEGMAWRIRRAVYILPEFVHWIGPVIIKGLKVYRKQKVELIWATGPPWSSLMAGYWLSKITFKPFIADFRDPWTHGHQRIERGVRWSKWVVSWEQRIIKKAEKVIFTSPLSTQIMKNKLDAKLRGKVETITNGFEPVYLPPLHCNPDNVCHFVYLGRLSKGHRSPDVVFQALRVLTKRGISKKIKVDFFGSSDGIEQDVESLGLSSIVHFHGQVSREDSFCYMRGADVLLLIQTITGDGGDVIGGKAYDYIGAKRPILAVVPDEGGDAWLLKTVGVGTCVGITDPEKIADGFERLVKEWEAGKLKEIDAGEKIKLYERKSTTSQLASLFDNVLF